MTCPPGESSRGRSSSTCRTLRSHRSATPAAQSLAQVFAALAGVDPRRVAALIDRLADDHDFIDTRYMTRSRAPHTWIDIKTQARVAVGRMLGLPIDGRRQEIGKLINDPWLVGESP